MEEDASRKTRTNFTNVTTQSIQLINHPSCKEADKGLMIVAATKEPRRLSRRKIGAACFPLTNSKRKKLLLTHRAEIMSNY